MVLLAMVVLRDENIAPCGDADDEMRDHDARALAEAAKADADYLSEKNDINAQLNAAAQAFAKRKQELKGQAKLSCIRRDAALELRARAHKDAIRRLIAAGHVLLELKAAQAAAEKADRPGARTKFTLKL